MKYVLEALLIWVLATSSVMSQLQGTISEEANPSYQYVQDNSPAAQLWRQIVAAKKANNGELHARLLEQYHSEFAHKVSIMDDTVEKPQAALISSNPTGHAPEWGLNDVLVHAGPIGTPLVGGANQRTIQIEADTSGNLYAGVLNQARDTLSLYKSTDFGLNWNRINYVYWSGGSRKWQAFDMFVADTANGMFKIGVVATATLASDYDGQVWWLSFNDNGSGFRAAQIQGRPQGRGFINPAIVSDAYDWAPSISYWYVAYQSVDSASGVGNAAIAALSSNWGDTWQLDSARAGFNDFDLDIDYNFGADTIHVLLTNDITPTNPNLRVRSISLGDFATSASWSQANVAGTADPEYGGCLASNRQTDELAVTYTKEESGNQNIYYTYNSTGKTGITFWTLDNALSAKANNESRARIHCQEEQGAYRIAYVSSGGGRDTVIYTSSFDITNFVQHQVVNEDKGASSSTAPDVVGFPSSSGGYNGGVIFAGFGPTNAYYDGSNIVVGIDEQKPSIAGTFDLSQNFPNPFNPTTQIRFTIPSSERVTIILFDLLGRKVATLVDEPYSAGTFTVTLDASKLPSGTYFYRMEAGQFRTTKKMLLLK